MANNLEPKITVILPCYNVEQYVGKCLESIFNQNCKEMYNVIAINDGSTDNTLQEINKYKDKLTKIIDITNHGVSYCRRLGVELADTKYVVFIDADDWVAEDFLQLLYNNISKDEKYIPFIYPGKLRDKKSSRRENVLYTQSQAVAGFISHELPGNLWRTIFEKEKFLGTPNNSLTYCEDLLFLVNYLVKNNLGILILPQNVYHYNTTNVNSATNNFYSVRHLQSFIDLPFELKATLSSNKDHLDNQTIAILNKEFIYSLTRVYRIIDYKSFKALFKQPQYDWLRQNKQGLYNGKINHKLYLFAFRHNMFFIIRLLETLFRGNKNKHKKCKYPLNK